MADTDRRVQRTRELLQRSLIEQIGERDYDAITIQEIVDRANVGRTTFYQHYTSKDDLLISCHEYIISEFRFSPRRTHPLTRQELLSPEAPQGLIAAYQHVQEAWGKLYPIFQGKDGALILRRIRDLSAQEIETNLRAVFTKMDSHIPLEMLSNYLAGAQLALVQWWLEKHRPHSAEILAQTFQRLQSAAIRDAFGRKEDDQK
jgi:AcrR family transcriptional regulator